MANCMTCRHNDKKAKYCPVKKAHTDLGYVLNCMAWAPTDEAEMKRFRAENAKLRELLLDYDKMLAIASDELGYQSRGLRMDSVLNALRIRMSELGIEVDE